MKLVLSFLIMFIVVSTVSAGTNSPGRMPPECEPDVYCMDSPDDDNNPCTPQPDDLRTPDYDESSDDVPCEDIAAQMIFAIDLELVEIASAKDLVGNELDWYEDPRSVNCERVPIWCQTVKYLNDILEREAA